MEELYPGGRSLELQSRNGLSAMYAGWAVRSPLVFVCLFFAFVSNLGVAANSAQMDEYKLKGALLKSFAKFVDWPATAPLSNGKKYFVLGVIGENPFQHGIEADYADQRIHNHRVRIKFIYDLDEITDCDLLFIARSEDENLEHILLYTRNKPILTIADTVGFAERGALINLFLKEGQVRFEINYEECINSGFFVNPRLLSSAVIVSTK